jgi:hypothetical protein
VSEVKDGTLLFYGHSSPLSNFYPASFAIDGVSFNCAEQFYYLKKAEYFKDRAAAVQILAATDPWSQKSLGKAIGESDLQWSSSNEAMAAMQIALKAKFTQNAYFHHKVFYRNVWDYKSGNYNELNRDLSYAPWNLTLPTVDTLDEEVEYFTNLFLDTAKFHIPNYTIKVKPRDKPYITHKCRTDDKVRNRWHKKYQRTKDIRDYLIFKEKRHKAKSTRRQAKQEYDRRMFLKLNNPNICPKDYWKTAKMIM